MNRHVFRSLLTLCCAMTLSCAGRAQGARIYLSPQVAAGLTCGSDYRNSAKLDFAGVDRALGLELRGGYVLNQHTSLFTGLGFGIYHYALFAQSIHDGAPDSIHFQAQQFVEIPLGIRFATYYGRHSFRARYYGIAGLKTCILNDARHDYHSVDKTFYGNGLDEESFNKVFVRVFVEGGFDIPMDYDSAILVGLSFSEGVSRNMAASGPLEKSNYGLLVGQLTFGIRFGL